MKLKKFERHHLFHTIRVMLQYLIVAFIAFEIRGVLLYDPIVPFTWPLRLTEFMITRTPFNTTMMPAQTCEDFNTVVRIMGNVFPRHSYGQSEFYRFDPSDPHAEMEPVIDRGVAYDEAGIIKWRYGDYEPYIAFEIAGNWTNHYDNENGKGISVKRISEDIDTFRNKMESNGFTFSDPNDIPLYRYPEGSFARKIGFSKGNYLYHFTIIEEEPPYDPMGSKNELPSDFQKPVHIAMNCAENSPELRSIYEQYLSIPHEFTGETSVVYRGRKDNVVRFTLYYPGGVIDQTQDELYDMRQNPMQQISKSNNFMLCTTLEKRNIGKEYPCYRPEKREFDVVTY